MFNNKFEFPAILIFILAINSHCDPLCSTPIECVIKEANDIINKDKITINAIQAQMDSYQAAISKLVDDGISAIKIEIYNKMKDFATQTGLNINTLTQSLATPFLNIKNDNDYITNTFANNLATSENKNHMYKDALIYQKIFDVFNNNVGSKSGNAGGWDDQSYKNSLWYGRAILSIGCCSAQSDGNGLAINIPQGYDVLWIRAHSSENSWFQYRMMYMDGNREVLPKFITGNRGLVEISPDGGAPDSYNKLHIWVPVPVPRPGNVVIHCDYNTSHWISGIALGKNLWGHAKNAAIAYHFNINPGSAIDWHLTDYNGDINAIIPNNRVTELRVPVVSNGKDKLFYIVEHNNTWNGVFLTAVYANGAQIERLRTTYINPFSVHYSSKLYSRYVAAKIPKELIKNGDQLVTIRIDFSNSNIGIYIREAGTHDYF